MVLVLADAIEVLDVAGATQQLHKVLVVGDDQQLEVPLSRATLDDSGRESGSAARRSPAPKVPLGGYLLHERVCQGLDVVPVQVGGGLVQGQNATVETEGFSQGQTDDQGGQHLHVHAQVEKKATARAPPVQPPPPATF